MASVRRENVKVVLIDTQYVVTDPLSFKSVVQNLTGKDSRASWVKESSFITATAKRKREPAHCNGTGHRFSSEQGKDCPVSGGHGGYSHDENDWKLPKDLERMILEMPPIDDWYQLLAQSNLL